MIRSILTPQERASAMRFGAYVKFAEAGIRPSQVDATIKQAAGVPSLVAPNAIAKAIVTVSVLTGVPIGIAAHIVDNHIKSTRGKEMELKTQTGYYRNAAQQLESGLSAADTSM